MIATSDTQYWLIRHPDTSGAVVARFNTSNSLRVPEEIAEYDDFIVESVPDQSTLLATTVDQSGLNADEKDRLSRLFAIID
jgi:hypothetical protein